MSEIINDPIQVVAVFKQGKIEPRKFLWNGREYFITVVNLVYSKFEGWARIYYFAVSDSANYFKLRFNSEDMTWAVVESMPV